MKNNHGQVLVIFVILLPVLFLFAAYVIDVSYIMYHKNKLDNINALVSDYVLENPNVSVEDAGKLIRENDSEVMIKKISFDEKIDISLEKEIKSIFGRLIGKNSYVIKSNVSKEKVILDDYVEDGLIVHYDGYDSPEENVWIDKSSNHNDLIIENFSSDKGSYYDKKSKGYVFNTIGTPSTRGISKQDLGITGNNEFTVEVVFSVHSYNEDTSLGILHFGDSPLTVDGRTFNLSLDEDNDRVKFSFANVAFSNVSTTYELDKIQAVSFAHEIGNMVINQTTGQSVLIDGEIASYEADGTTTINLVNSKLYVGQNGPYNNEFRGFIGTIHSIRIYNRFLTLEEQKQNYKIDLTRFKFDK